MTTSPVASGIAWHVGSGSGRGTFPQARAMMAVLRSPIPAFRAPVAMAIPSTLMRAAPGSPKPTSPRVTCYENSRPSSKPGATWSSCRLPECISSGGLYRTHAESHSIHPDGSTSKRSASSQFVPTGLPSQSVARRHRGSLRRCLRLILLWCSPADSTGKHIAEPATVRTWNSSDRSLSWLTDFASIFCATGSVVWIRSTACRDTPVRLSVIT